MPLGFERVNERQQRPNTNINFVKPLSSSSAHDQHIAQDFLERIAAQCYPIMKQHHISVMSLEEHEPNPEFLGRNFNAGEIVQLVLKDKQGRWLSFNFVQMVMMHELAHCKQMNHSRLFWKERNLYADAMKELWSKGYKGEGLWGRGLHLETGQLVHDRMPNDADIPEHLCGGAYRRARGRKRKRGEQDVGERPKVSYAERQQKRIAKKFGVHGEGAALGDDELVRGGLEKKRHYGKPKVASSKRGRELRASAALARFEGAKAQQQRETPDKTPELDEDQGSELEDWSDEDVDSPFAIASDDEDSVKNKDGQGRDMVRVCGDEEDQRGGGKDEMDDLRLMRGGDKKSKPQTAKLPSEATPSVVTLEDDPETESEPEEAQPPPMPMDAGRDDSETESEPDDRETTYKQTTTAGPVLPISPRLQQTSNASEGQDHYNEPVPPDPPLTHNGPITPTTLTCPICSLENGPESPTCMACAHVLKTALMPNHWRCKSEACQSTKYVNAGDAGRCGLCGGPKPAPAMRPVGVVGADVLRWD